MDSTDIYYSDTDNSQLIDSNNTEWINNAVLVENESISWNDTGPEITVDYSESATNIDHSLNNTDGYETADAGDSTETSQYFSILDSTITENVSSVEEETPKCVLNVEVEKEETILPDITANAESEIEELNLDDKISENEVILYRPAGSEELFAVQIAEDEHGILQKYKFRVKQNEDGQFEAIPGTMEVESASDNIVGSINEMNPDFEDFVEQKHDAMMLNSNTIANEEPLEFMNDVENEENSDMEVDYIQNENIPTSGSVNNTSYEQDQDEEYQTVDGIHVTGDSDTNSRQDFVEEFTVSNIERTEDDSEEEYEVEELEEAFQDDNTSDAYEDGMTQIENIFNSDIRECHTNSVLQHKANISNLKIPILDSGNLKHNVTIYKDDKHLSYLVIKGKEKENVLLDRKSKFNTINMRSILKCNNPSFNVPDKCIPPKVEKPQHSIPSIISTKDSNVKHIIKPKEIISPVKSKSARQPRKQSLNPVNRVGSEIIVQPLVYSVDEIGRNNNTLMPPSKHKRILPEVLQVSDDSDPEFVLKPLARKRKRGRPKKRQNSVEITILDSDEEEKSETTSVIEVPSDQDSNDESDTTDDYNEQESDVTNLNSEKDKPVKKVDKAESISNKNSKPEEPAKVNKNEGNLTPMKKNKCPLCPKTFPRLVTLKRHINMHNVRKSLRSRQNIPPSLDNKEVNKQNLNSNVSETQNKPLAYNCKKCKLNFLLESQYKRHQTVHISKKPVDKVNLINKKVSPKKKIEKHVFTASRHLRSNSKINNEKSLSLTEKKTKTTTKNNFKCEFCGQSYSTRTLLFSHRKTHKTFPCPNCKTTFTAKILLDDHLRKNCVKSPTKAHRQSVAKKTLFKKTFVKCEKCSRVFPNQKSLQIHNSVSHRRKSYMIPDKIPSDKPEKETGLLKSNKMPHGGVPMSLKMQQAFDKMKQKT